MSTSAKIGKMHFRRIFQSIEALCTLALFLPTAETCGYNVNRQRHKELTWTERENLQRSREIQREKELEVQRQEEEKRRKMERRENEAKSRVEQTRRDGARILDETFPYIQKVQDAYHFATQSIKDWAETTSEDIPEDVKTRGAKYRATALRLANAHKNLSGMIQSSEVAAAETLRQIQALKSDAVAAAKDGERICDCVIDLHVAAGQDDLQEIGERIKHVSADLDWSRGTTDPETFSELDATRKELLRKKEACDTALANASSGSGYGAEATDWNGRLRTVQAQLAKLETLEADVESFAVQVAALSGKGKKTPARR